MTTQAHLQEQQSFAVQQQFKHQLLFTPRPPIYVPTPQAIKIHSEQHQQAINISNGAMDAAIMLASLESTIISDREEEYSLQRCDTRAVQEEYSLPSCDSSYDSLDSGYDSGHSVSSADSGCSDPGEEREHRVSILTLC